MVTILSDLRLAGPAVDNAPLPVASIQGQARAFAIFQRLVDNDATALPDVGVAAPVTYAPQSHEWGVGYDRDTGRWILVRGGPNETRYTGNGLEAVVPYAHSHPYDPLFGTLAGKSLTQLQQDGIVLAGRTVQQLCTWLSGSRFAMLSSLPAGLPPVFPSNGDISANYTTGAQRFIADVRVDRRPSPRPAQDEVPWSPGAGADVMCPTARVGNAGWFSANPADPQLIVTYGPTTVTLKDNATTDQGLRDAAVIKQLFAPLTLRAGGVDLWTGAIKVDVALQNNAWLIPSTQVPGNTVTRAAAAALTNGRA